MRDASHRNGFLAVPGGHPLAAPSAAFERGWRVTATRALVRKRGRDTRRAPVDPDLGRVVWPDPDVYHRGPESSLCLWSPPCAHSIDLFAYSSDYFVDYAPAAPLGVVSAGMAPGRGRSMAPEEESTGGKPAAWPARAPSVSRGKSRPLDTPRCPTSRRTLPGCAPFLGPCETACPDSGGCSPCPARRPSSPSRLGSGARDGAAPLACHTRPFSTSAHRRATASSRCWAGTSY
jgi:hypothetical protein